MKKFLTWWALVILGMYVPVDCSAKESLHEVQKQTVGVDSTKPVVPFYSVNLMWINRKLDANQKYIYPASDEAALTKKFLSHIFNWAAVTNGGIVQLWIDSLLTPADAIKATEKLIQDYADHHKDHAPIVIRNVRDLPRVQADASVFGSEVPIFFRVDLLRVIAQVHGISTGKTPYFVYSDLDVEPISREQIFDAETLTNLQNFGLVMAYVPLWKGYENSFQIVSCQRPDLLKAMEYTLIDLNIARAYSALRNEFYCPEHVPNLQKLLKEQMQQKTENKDLAVDVQSYSINLFWINSDYKEDQQYIHPGQGKEELEDHFFDPLFAWALTHPTATVNLWFDKQLTPQKAVDATRVRISEHAKMHPEAAQIVIRNVRDLPLVQHYAQLFCGDISSGVRESVYQMIAALTDLQEDKVSYFVCEDLLDISIYKDYFNATSFAKEELFTKQVLEKLHSCGMHSFWHSSISLVILKNDKRLFEVLKNEWFKQVVEVLETMLRGQYCYGNCCRGVFHLQQIVYCSYPSMFQYFYHFAGLGTLYIKEYDAVLGKNVSRMYDKEKDGLGVFGIDRIKCRQYLKADPSLPKREISSFWIPTKKVVMPRVELLYDDTAPVR